MEQARVWPEWKQAKDRGCSAYYIYYQGIAKVGAGGTAF